VSLPNELLRTGSAWLEEPSACNGFVVTSRARYARNLAGHPFAPHSPANLLSDVHAKILARIKEGRALTGWHHVELANATAMERAFLKEARLVSKEMERGGASRSVLVAPDWRSSVMINEEDHLRLQCLEPGLQIGLAQKRLARLDAMVGGAVPYAWHERLGYLTACPTNVGTGLRVSVMMHLPGLALSRRLEAALRPLANYGLTARGFMGENTETTGDLHQISNEVTLGKTVEEIEETLAEMVGLLIEAESEARSLLLQQDDMTVRDAVWRAFGILLHARRIETTEAMNLLSKVRLGIDGGYFGRLSHEVLNRLLIDIQPAHIVLAHDAADETEARDIRRAEIIRNTLRQAAES
jgi:protein arginine kinase